MRQVKRLLKRIYHEHNFYLIHVDSRQDLMHRELSAVADRFPANVRMVRNRRPGIWGGISVLEMLVASIEELLEMRDWKWDFVLNLSESGVQFNRHFLRPRIKIMALVIFGVLRHVKTCGALVLNFAQNVVQF